MRRPARPPSDPAASIGMTTGAFFDRQRASEEFAPPVLFRLLRRFEVRRVDVAARLLPPGQALLDVGCGDGELERRLADRYTRIVAGDVAPTAVREAKQKLEGLRLDNQISFRVIDAN